MTDDLEKEVLFRKFGQLASRDKEKIMEMIDSWSKK